MDHSTSPVWDDTSYSLRFAEGTSIGQPEDSIEQDNRTIGMDVVKGREFYPMVVHGIRVPT